MKRTKFDLNRKYNKEDIVETLNNLQIKRNNNVVETFFNNRIIASSEVSDKYEIFDFSPFAEKMVEQVENFFTPEEYSLRIRKGEQELRLLGEEIKINGESYYKMFNVLNSSDKSKALQINIGLLRRNCVNGLVIGDDNSFAHLKTKHYKKSLGNKIPIFERDIQKFNVSIDYQSSLIESLANKDVSYYEICREFLDIDGEDDVKDSNIFKLVSLGKKLFGSRTDRIKELTMEQVAFINNPYDWIKNNKTGIDLELKASQIFNCYTELWRSYDSSVMNRETTKIVGILKNK